MNLGFGEMVALAILALVVFGPERLPEAARNAGQMIARFRREANSTLDEFKRSADLAELRQLRNELREVSADLKLRSPLTGPMGLRRSWVSRGLGGMPSLDVNEPWEPPPMDPVARLAAHESPIVRPSGPAPFDPDAT